MTKLTLPTIGALLLFGFSAVPAFATVASSGSGGSSSAPSGASYTIYLPNYAVSDITVYTYGSPFDALSEGYTVDTAASPGPTTFPVSYLTDTQVTNLGPFVYNATGSFLLGVTSGLPGDASGQQHLVLFTNDSFANSAQNIAFGTLFPNTNETTLINDLTSGSNFGDVYAFAGGDAVNGSNGSIAFLPGSNFEAIAFSGGQIIGSGTSSFTYDVPEPSTLGMMLVGILGIGVAGYRRSKRITPDLAA